MGSWYLMDVFSGDENKVKALVEIESRKQSLDHLIRRVIVPVTLERAAKDSKLIDKRRKLFPGKIAVEIECVSNEVIYFLTHLPGIQQFTGGTPIRLRNDEIEALVSQSQAMIGDSGVEVGFGIGSRVRIKEGPLQNFAGTVQEIAGTKVFLLVNMFGSERRVESSLNFLEEV